MHVITHNAEFFKLFYSVDEIFKTTTEIEKSLLKIKITQTTQGHGLIF